MIAEILAGAVFTAAGVWFFLNGRALQRRGVHTTGRVVDLQYNPDPANGTGNYHPVLEFRTAGGEQVQAVAREGGNPAPARVGADVRVLYDPVNPSVAEIDTFMGRGTWLPVVAALVGVGLIVNAIIHR
jgi:hypothetical protein